MRDPPELTVAVHVDEYLGGTAEFSDVVSGDVAVLVGGHLEQFRVPTSGHDKSM
jgi:hypothetical protein